VDDLVDLCNYLQGIFSVDSKTDKIFEFWSSIPWQLVHQRFDRQSEDYNLAALLGICHNSLCVDALDKIFGLLDLADDCRNTGLKGDYSKSISDGYTDVIRFHHHQETRYKSPSNKSQKKLLNHHI
jgi:hypothetical protein